MRPYGLFPFSTIPLNNTGQWFRRGLGIIHCLLIDTGDGLILVDAGYGIRDYTHPTNIVRNFNRVIGLVNEIEETALRQIIALGYDPGDVKHIFLTHMHLDHTGGILDFPHAKVHVFEEEYQFSMAGKGLEAKAYIQQHWAHNPDWEIHKLQGDKWFGLDCTPRVEIGEVEIFFMPFLGHTRGNCAVVAHLPDDHWIIHAGDTYGYHGQIHPLKPFYPPFQWLFRPIFLLHRVARSFFKYDKHFQHFQRELGEKIIIFNSHDPHEFERLSGEKIIDHN
ncbi:MAG: MBL fold metallo-hydrolase [Anaerolineales bacterium]|nr:MAG: MBL fold metallo-hydrolase [Anaerolineales bacterium]